MHPRVFLLDFNSLKFPLPGFWFIEGASNARKLEKRKHLSSPFSRFQLGKFYHYWKYVYYDLTNFSKTVETGVDPRLAVITNVSRSLLSWVIYSAIWEQLHNGMYVFVLFVQIRFTAGIITCSIRFPKHHNIFSLHPNCRINDVCDAGIRPLLTKVHVCTYFLLEKKLAFNLH